MLISRLQEVRTVYREVFLMELSIDEAIKYAIDGDAVLFLGAGFSHEARNKENEFLPVGRELSVALCRELGITESYDLSIISERYIDEKNIKGFISYLKEKLLCYVPSDNQLDALNLPWRRIYTTNYDNVAEVCSKKNDVVRDSVTMNTPIKAVNNREGAIIHLNGSLLNVSEESFYDEFKITDESYLRDGFMKSNWASIFLEDINNAKAVVFIGYSLSYDLDLQRVIYSTIKRKSVFINDENIDDNQRYKIKKWGMLYDGALLGFADRVRMLRQSYKPKLKLHNLKSLKEMRSVDYKLHDIQSMDVFKLFLYGEYNRYWFRNENYCIARKKVYNDIIENLKSSNFCLLHSDLGNGKSVMLDYIASQLVMYAKVYLLENLENIAEDFEDIKPRDDKDVYILIDDLDACSVRAMKELEKYQNPRFKIIATCRSYIEPLLEDKIKSQCSMYFYSMTVMDINILYNQDINDLAQRFENNNLWGEHSALSHSAKRKKLQKELKSNMSNILYVLLDSNTIKDKIAQVLCSVKKDNLLKGYLVMQSICDICKFKLPGYEIARLIDIKLFDIERHVREANIGSEVICLENNNIRLRSSVFSRYILHEMADENFALDVLSLFHKNISNYSTSKYLQIRRKLNARTNLIEIFGGAKYHRLSNFDIDQTVYSFYEKIQNIEKENPFFWLQFAIVALNLGEYDISKIYFENAYAYSKKLERFDSYQLDTHYARYLFTVLVSNHVVYDFSAIEKAHILLKNNSNVGERLYYVLKQTGWYYKVYDKFYEKFTAIECKKFRNMIDDINSKYEMYFSIIEKNRSYLLANSVKNAFNDFKKLLSDSCRKRLESRVKKMTINYRY